MHRLETTSRGRHALTAILDLCKQHSGKPVPLSDIAASRQISLSYLEQMFAGLRRHGLVKSHRGPGGGYELAKPASDISVAEIIRAAESPANISRPDSKAQRLRQSSPSTMLLWDQLSAHLFKKLEAITLADVIDERVEVYQKVFRTEA